MGDNTTEETGNQGHWHQFCSKKLTDDDHASAVEVMLPPLAMVCLIAGGLLSLVVSDRRQHEKRKRMWRSVDRSKVTDHAQKINSATIVRQIIGDGSFYSDFDKEVINHVKFKINTIKGNMLTCVPMFVAIGASTFTLFLYDPIVNCLWPEVGRPDINTTITCFLLPAGLVYALSFGFVFQQALEKQGTILKKITTELSLIDQILTMSTKLKLPSREHQMAILKAAKSEAIFMAMLVQNREPSSFTALAPPGIKVEIWNVIDILRDAATHPEYSFQLNEILVKKLIGYIIQLNNICADRMGSLHSKIHPLQWVFLEILGSMALFGVMMIDASSRSMEMAMCHITVFSVSMLCYVLADLDSSFNGFFRVDLSVIPDVVRRAENMFEMVRAGQTADLSYPQLN